MKYKIISQCPDHKVDLVPALTIFKEPTKWWGKCPILSCGAIVNMYFSPTEYQLDILYSDSQLLGYFGGFGAGKTSSGGMKVLQHGITIPNGETLIGAETWAQMNKTCLKEMVDIMPADLVDMSGTQISQKSSGSSGTKWQMLLINGHLLHAKVFDDEGKLRSLNLTGWWIEEGSEVKQSVFDQLKTRLRHDAALEYAKDEDGVVQREAFTDLRGNVRYKPIVKKSHYLGLVTSNPDSGWIRTELVFRASQDNTHYYGKEGAEEAESLNVEGYDTDPQIEVFVVPTEANYYLPPDYIANQSIGKSKHWIARYLQGSFAYAEGIIYPEGQNAIVDQFPIPRHWKRLISSDFGRRDATADIAGAIDPESDVLYIYDENYTPEGDIQLWVEKFNRIYKAVPASLWLMPPIGDPAGQHRGQADATSWFDLYADHGIYYIPSRTGVHSELGIASGIAKVSEYFAAGKIKIMRNCVETIKELNNYRYKTVSFTGSEDVSEKPVGGFDHLMDALRGLISMAPRNVTTPLSDLVSYSYIPTSFVDDLNTERTAESMNDPYGKHFWSSVGNNAVSEHYRQDPDDLFEDLSEQEDEYAF